MEINKVYIASDHAGVLVKEEIKKILSNLDIDFYDLGTNDENISVDYPDYAKKACKKVLEDENNFGILICGSGTGMQIAANKIKNIRAVFCYDNYSAKMSRLDNNSNVITLRAREFDNKKYEDIIKTFLGTKFSNELRHKRRIEKLN